MIVPKNDFLIESSWETCNKVGGIYTVVKSKAAIANEMYSQYLLIGPYIKENQDVNFSPKIPSSELKQIFDELKKEGIICHYGVWEIKGSPTVVLIDAKGYAEVANDIKKTLWETYQVDSLYASGDFTEPMIWSWAVGRFIEKMSEVNSGNIVAQFHEWLAGISLLYLKRVNSRVGTVFTTHATMLGRAIAGGGEPLYSMIHNINPEEEAKKRGIADKFTTERACAKNADVFTTVSQVTGFEAEKLLGRRPDVLLLNGLDVEKFPTFEETSVKHIMARDQIRDFLTYFFFPYYSFDLTKTLNLFIVGRYEYTNKGIDILISALAKLNEKLKEQMSDKKVAVFFFIPSETHGIKTELLENKTFYHHIKDFVHNNVHDIQQKIINSLVSGNTVTESNIFTKEFQQMNKKHILRFKREGLPGLTTHNMDELKDPIIKAFRQFGLDNREENPVKVIFYPVYLTGADGLLDLTYYDAIVGNHLGIFASYYEPWGYTPLESAALGVPAITSDLSGFGQFIEKQTDTQDKYCGIKVLKRMNVAYDEQVENLANMILNFLKLGRHERIRNKMDAKRLSKLSNWRELFNNYIEAHNLAKEKHQ